MQVLIVFNSMYTRKNELMAASSHAPDGIAYQCMYKILYNLTNLGYQICNYKYFEFGNTSCHKTRLPCKKTNNMLQNYSMGEVASSSLLVGTHSRISICTYIYIHIISYYIFMRIYISTPKGCPENWRSNHRDRSMFPSFQSIPWGYTALQVWAPSFHSVIQAYYCPPIHPYF